MNLYLQNRNECSPLYVIGFLEDMYALPAPHEFTI